MKYTVESLSNLLYTNMLVVGRPKTGKTFSCKTLRKLKKRPWVTGQKLMICDFDNGCQPLIRAAMAEGWADELEIYRYDVQGKTIATDKAEVNRVKDVYLNFVIDINKLFDNLNPDNTWRDPSIAPYAVVVDALTVTQDMCLDFTLQTHGKELGGDKVHGGAEYKTMQDKLVESIRALRSLPCFSAWLAHETLREEQVKMPTQPKGSTKAIDPVITGAYFRLPFVNGQLSFTIGGEFGVVLYTRIEQITSTQREFKWDTQAVNNIYAAGSRLTDNLPPVINQDFDLVVEGSTDPRSLFAKK